MDTHFYAYYYGNIVIDSNQSIDGISPCFFNSQRAYCYLAEPNSSVNKFYYSKCRYGRLVIPVNHGLSLQWDLEDLNDYSKNLPNLKNSLIGIYGCIPKFIRNEQNQLAYTIDNETKVITLHIARHEMINELNKTILELESHFFPLSDDDYNKLNDLFKSHNFQIQGGVDDHCFSELKVYDPSGSSKLIKIKRSTNPPHPNN